MADEYFLLKPERISVPSSHRNFNDRLRSIKWAERLVSTANRGAVVETESTGIDNKYTVIHIAITSGRGEELFESLVKLISRASVAQDFLDGHGLTRKELNAAPTAQELSAEIKKALSGYSEVTFNAEFRERICRQTGIGSGASMECVMISYSAFLGDWMASKSEYKFQKLPKPGRKFHAMDDCKTTVDLIRFMASFPKPEVKPWWRFW